MNYHFTETLEKGQPLVLLLEYIAADGSKQHKGYLLSDLAQVIANISVQVREWLVSVLTDISEEQFHPDTDENGMFVRLSLLNIGPLRTARAESFDCDSLGEALATISRDTSFTDVLSPLDHRVLRSIGTEVEPLSTEPAQFKTEITR